MVLTAQPAAQKGSVDIVIVNWNSGALLQRCFDALAESDHRRVRQIVLVDNGSVDGSAAVNGRGMALDMVEAGQNLGFGRACNLAAARSSGEYILLLNPDTEVGHDAIEHAAKYLDDDKAQTVGVVGIMLTDRDGTPHRHCARFPRWNSFIGNSFGLTRILRRWFPPMLMREFDHRSDRDVDHVMGAFYLIRRTLFEQLGGFDEKFFVYLEDLDLSYRVHRAGYKIRYLASAEAFHYQGGTSEKVRAKRLFYSLSSGILYAFKHFPAPQAWILLAVTYLVEPISRSVRAIFRGSLAELWFTWRGFWMLFGATPSLLRTAKIAANERSEPCAGERSLPNRDMA